MPDWRAGLSEALLRDPRDWPLLAHVIRASPLVPAAVAVYAAALWAPGWFLPAAGLFALLYGLYLPRFITMFHDANHRPLFRRRFHLLNRYLHQVLGPLFGLAPNTYYIHHILMHHPTDNSPEDESTTLPYQRDSFLHFLRYYLRFFFSVFAVARFMRRRYHRHPEFTRRVVEGELLWLAFVIALSLIDLWATLVVFVIPLVVTRSCLIIGNWGEHAFIDTRAPENLFRNSVDLHGERFNPSCFNVGYHIGHHLRPGAHFSTHPAWFEANKERFGEEDAIVLKDLHYPHLWLLLMLKRYDSLADRFVQLPGAPVRSREEVIALLRSRVRQVCHAG